MLPQSDPTARSSRDLSRNFSPLGLFFFFFLFFSYGLLAVPVFLLEVPPLSFFFFKNLLLKRLLRRSAILDDVAPLQRGIFFSFPVASPAAFFFHSTMAFLRRTITLFPSWFSPRFRLSLTSRLFLEINTALSWGSLALENDRPRLEILWK